MITAEDLELAKTTTDPEIQLILVHKMVENYTNDFDILAPGFNSLHLYDQLFLNPNLIIEAQLGMLYKKANYKRIDNMFKYPNLAPEVFDILIDYHQGTDQQDVWQVLNSIYYANPETQRRLELRKLLG